MNMINAPTNIKTAGNRTPAVEACQIPLSKRNTPERPVMMPSLRRRSFFRARYSSNLLMSIMGICLDIACAITVRFSPHARQNLTSSLFGSAHLGQYIIIVRPGCWSCKRYVAKIYLVSKDSGQLALIWSCQNHRPTRRSHHQLCVA